MAVRVLTISRKPGSNPDHPFINLGGKWLKENGFKIGDKVLIEGRKGNLQIRAIEFLEDASSNEKTKSTNLFERGVIIYANNT